MNHPLAEASLACLGGGHGLYQTLSAAKLAEPASITGIVTVADDGGSSGRLRKELGQIPPGDLRMALAALADTTDPDSALWARALQHRFGGNGALAGHAVGNLMLAGLTELLGREQAALDTVARLTRSAGRVVPMSSQPLDIEADVTGLDDDPRIVRTVRGQVAVATTPGTVRRVRLIPDHPPANPDAVAAIRSADLVTIGPGSWFSSVIPHLLVPGIADAINSSSALRVVVLNLSAEMGETTGFSHERHIHMLAQHAPTLKVDRVLVDASVLSNAGEREFLNKAVAQLGGVVVYDDVQGVDADGQPCAVHDAAKLSAALGRVYAAG
ncbi:gluconeogenesis factor YvcK family protein [Corynebacterium uterequi]|uniref:Putative gluconeogenesis factor n=1 Tax=Corynebacterium uterequi TaxID=1072256 RepID=A0A0G3HCT5_9CORY|nr:uridine diphosphate-N-acetylglucosamine-binding protein YvcK [Corynebacterium uterequi]AKK11166.1 cofD-related protein [Corynebacterium uterequi]